MTSVVSYSYTHSVTYVADNILKSLKDIIRLSGLDPSNLVDSWDSKMLAVKTWLNSGDLQKVKLEIYDPATDKLITRWDVDIMYSASSADDGTFWTDTEQLVYAIKKAGLAPSQAKYDVILQTRAGRPNVQGWGPCDERSTEGMVKQSLGTTVEHNGLGAQTGYWRQK